MGVTILKPARKVYGIFFQEVGFMRLADVSNSSSLVLPKDLNYFSNNAIIIIYIHAIIMIRVAYVRFTKY